MTIAGFRSVPRGVERQSMTWRLVMPGRFVGRFQHRDAVDDVFEVNGAFDFRHHRAGIGIPFRQTLTRRTLSPSSTKIFEP